MDLLKLSLEEQKKRSLQRIENDKRKELAAARVALDQE
jgi:hypothetical protein